MYTSSGSKLVEKIMAGPMLFSGQCHLVSRKIRACDESHVN